MNAGELREYLKDYPADMPVIMEKDAEGNGYSPLCSVNEGLYIADSTWSGWVHFPEDDDDEDDDDYVPEGSVRAIILGPVN